MAKKVGFKDGKKGDFIKQMRFRKKSNKIYWVNSCFWLINKKKMNIYTFFQVSFTFFMILDPLGNVPFFVSILKHIDPLIQRRIILREMLIALFIMVIFVFFGKAIFSLFQLKQSVLLICGGIILFIIGIKMIFSMPEQLKEKKISKDPLIVPLAVPAVAGPGILAAITLFGAESQNRFLVMLAVITAWIVSLPILLLSTHLNKILGYKGLLASERLMGFIVVLISVQMTINGVIEEVAYLSK